MGEQECLEYDIQCLPEGENCSILFLYFVCLRVFVCLCTHMHSEGQDG